MLRAIVLNKIYLADLVNTLITDPLEINQC